MNRMAVQRVRGVAVSSSPATLDLFLIKADSLIAPVGSGVNWCQWKCFGSVGKLTAFGDLH